MHQSRAGRPSASRLTRTLGLATIAFSVLVAGTEGTQDAIANGDTRTLTIQHMHTKELASVTFRRDGRYDERGLEQLNWLLRDWRTNEPTKMDPRLFDVVWEAHRSVGSDQPVHVVSAYRSPATNGALRRRSRGVAKNSQHMLGKAMDFYLPDVSVDKIRAVAMRMQRGGVGWYPTSGTPFVHLDVGSVRSWPRMTREQLVALFPDERTVHLPRDGKPLSGYEVARAEILARGGAVRGEFAVAEEEGSGRRRSLWAALFGGEDEEEDLAESGARRSGPAARTQVTAYAAPRGGGGNSDDAGMYAALVEPAPEPRAPAPRGAAAEPRTAPAAAPAPARPPEPVAAVPAPVPAPAAAPVASQPSQPAAVPLPPQSPVRVAAIQENGPRLVWEQGATGLARLGNDAPALPANAASGIPMPPPRPGQPIPVALAAAGAAEAPAAALAFAAVPIPPARPGAASAPVMQTLAALPPARVASAAAVPPVTETAAVAPPRAGARPQRGSEDERAALRALFARVATTPSVPQGASVRVAAARVRQQGDSVGQFVADQGAGLALAFSASPGGELRADRFTGPAVKPLPVRR